MIAPPHQEQPASSYLKPQGAYSEVLTEKEMNHPVVAIQKAVMPELYTSLSSSPQIHVLYLAPGQEIISPQQVMASNPEKITENGKLLKISPTMAVKCGSSVSLIEAKTMLYVAEKTSIPIPKVFAAYAYGPLDPDSNLCVSRYETYIFMQFIEGEDLDKAWAKCTPDEKQTISADLKKYITELRSLPAADYIGSVDRGPVTDVILEWSTPHKGPFESVEDFHAIIVDTYTAKLNKLQIGPYIRSLVGANKHDIVFTHGDLAPRNIIVKDGCIKAIIDWEMGGWYPEYWEFAKAFWLERFVSDWGTHLLGVLTPYLFEHLVYGKLLNTLI